MKQLPANLLSRIESELLPYVEKPIRYIGNELHIIRKDLSKISLDGVLCFPDVYDIGMSHYGLQILYHIVNKNPSWALSRCFHPAADAEKIMREKNIPLYSLEYCTALSQADWVGFSLQYELACTGVVNMLDLGGVPIWSAERNGSHPIIIAGGPCMSNPEPIADFIDAAVIGDGEETIVEICSALQKSKKDSAGRADILHRLSEISGVYVPSLYTVKKNGLFLVPDIKDKKPVQAAKVRELSNDNYPTKPLVPLIDVVHHRLAAEVMRGCSHGCRFCAAGMYYRPVRERKAPDINQQILEGIQSTGWRDVSLLSLSTADYSRLNALLVSGMLLKHEHHVAVSLPSTRIDSLTAQQLEQLNEIYCSSSFTLAPEAASQRLRNAINKDFTDKQILESIDMLIAHGIQTIKLYFMIGLPTETQDDINAIIDLLHTISEKGRSSSGRIMLSVTISPFSPKAGTPFQWQAMESQAVLMDKGRSIKRAFEKRKNVKISYRDADVTFLETVIGRGDRSVSKVIHRAWQLGARLDAWEEQFDFKRWTQAARDCRIDLNVFASAIPQNQSLPWQAVTTGVSEKYLRNEYEKALAGIITPDCRNGECSACGVCGIVPRKLVSKDDGKSIIDTNIVPAASIPGRSNPVSPRYLYRVRYRKGPQIRFLGHRDMVAVIHRAFVAGRIPLDYSQGYHPHPRMSFGPPLPLGVAGEAELFDAELRELWHADFNSINQWLPEDLEMIELMQLPVKPVSIQAALAAGKYRFICINEKISIDLDRSIKEFLAKASVVVQSKKGEGLILKDIAPLIRQSAVINPQTFEAILSLEQGKSCSPGDVISGLFKDVSLHDFLVIRIEGYSLQNGEYAIL